MLSTGLLTGVVGLVGGVKSGRGIYRRIGAVGKI